MQNLITNVYVYSASANDRSITLYSPLPSLFAKTTTIPYTFALTNMSATGSYDFTLATDVDSLAQAQASSLVMDEDYFMDTSSVVFRVCVQLTSF